MGDPAQGMSPLETMYGCPLTAAGGSCLPGGFCPLTMPANVSRYRSTMLFAFSACPSVSGWKAVDIAVRVPHSLVRCCQPVNRGSRSETKTSGRPCSLKYVSMSFAAKRSAVKPFWLAATQCARFDRVSMKVMIVLLPP